MVLTTVQPSHRLTLGSPLQSTGLMWRLKQLTSCSCEMTCWTLWPQLTCHGRQSRAFTPTLPSHASTTLWAFLLQLVSSFQPDLDYCWNPGWDQLPWPPLLFRSSPPVSG